MEFGIKIIPFNEKNVKIQLWDTAGKKIYNSILKATFKKSNAVILVYDVTNEDSFTAIKDRIEIIKNNENKAIIALVAQKCDLQDRVISEEKGKELADELEIEFFEVSAKNGYNIKELFNYLIQQCIFSATVGEADIGAI